MEKYFDDGRSYLRFIWIIWKSPFCGVDNYIRVSYVLVFELKNEILRLKYFQIMAFMCVTR